MSEELRKAAIAARDFITSSDNSSGCCMCGSAVEGHDIGAGHAPVDDGIYHANHIVEAINAALAIKPTDNLRDALDASLAKRSVPTMDPPYTAAFNAALDMVARDTALAAIPMPPTLDDRARLIKLARQNLALTQGCMECNADDERRWMDTIRWLEEQA